MTEQDKLFKKDAARNHIILGVLVVLSLPFQFVSAMLYDAPGSENNYFLNIFTVSLISFPVVYVLSIIVAKIYMFKGLYKKALISSYIPYLNIIFMIFAYIGINTVCSGRFIC